MHSLTQTPVAVSTRCVSVGLTEAASIVDDADRELPRAVVDLGRDRSRLGVTHRIGDRLSANAERCHFDREREPTTLAGHHHSYFWALFVGGCLSAQEQRIGQVTIVQIWSSDIPHAVARFSQRLGRERADPRRVFPRRPRWVWKRQLCGFELQGDSSEALQQRVV